MGRININYTNWIGIPVTKQCLNKMAGEFSSLMEMSSNSSPSGSNATNNYRKLTLYLNSQMKGKSSRHLNSQINTKILRWNDLEQCIGKLCSLKQYINMCKSSSVDGTQVQGPIWMGLIKEDFGKDEFLHVFWFLIFILGKWRSRLGLRTESKFQVVGSVPCGGSCRPRKSQMIVFPSPSTWVPCTKDL